jgi:hypothetical protein
MTLPTVTKSQIIRALDDLPPESLVTVAEFVEFLRVKFSVHASSGRVAKLGGLWKGYSFSEEEIRAARREAWAGLGRKFNA